MYLSEIRLLLALLLSCLASALAFAANVLSPAEIGKLFDSRQLPASVAFDGTMEFYLVDNDIQVLAARQVSKVQLDGDRKHIFYEDEEIGEHAASKMQVELVIHDGQQLSVDIAPENKTASCRGFLDASSADKGWYEYLGVLSVVADRASWDDHADFRDYFVDDLSTQRTDSLVTVKGHSKYGSATAKFDATNPSNLVSLSIEKAKGDLFGAKRGGRIIGVDYPHIRAVQVEFTVTEFIEKASVSIPAAFSVSIRRVLASKSVTESVAEFTLREVKTGREASLAYSRELISPLPPGVPVTMADSTSGLAFAWDGDWVSPTHDSTALGGDLPKTARNDRYMRLLAVANLIAIGIVLLVWVVRRSRSGSNEKK